MGRDIGEDRLAELWNAGVGSSTQRLIGQKAEEALDEVEPRRVGRREVQVHVREVRQELAARAKERRLALNISQQELAERSGVSLGSIKRFESSGQVSLASLLEIALVLGRLGDFEALFISNDKTASLFEPELKKRKRSSRKTR